MLSRLTAFVFVAAGMGCVEPAAPEPIGYVTVPLTASGAGGVTYHLPPNTFLQLTRPDGESSAGRLDDSATTQTIPVPSGTYAVSLVDAGGDTTVWPLTRVQPDGTTDVVQGSLRPTPTITVADGQTSSVVIRFQVADVGPIMFHLGALDISIAVDETEATSFDLAVNAPALDVAFMTSVPTPPPHWRRGCRRRALPSGTR